MKKNLELTFQVAAWNKKTKLGRAFDSSTGYNFIPIGGGKMSPDVSWIDSSRLDGINITGFIPVVPDFASQRVVGVPPIEATDEGVIELRSQSDRLTTLQTKMLEYQRLGVKLALLINPQDKQVEIYRLDRDTQVLDSPTAIDCSWLMPDFRLDLTEIL